MFRILTALFILISFSAEAQQPIFKGVLPNFILEKIIYPPYARQNCIQGVVKIGFKVNEKGEVFDTNVVEGIGADLDLEALRIIKLSSGKWITPLNYNQGTLIIIPVNFKLEGYGCESVSKETISLAIKEYKEEEELINIVKNFYLSKALGTFKPEDEDRVLIIKRDLRIDEEYLDEKVALGQKKIKQGDLAGACEDFNFVKQMGSDKANEFISKYCK